MVIMDFKGIAWVGNFYEKFEAMCLEVEEVVCEDTIKFVENQAQTVGASVKKFYSDVVQDLLPVSCVGPDNLASADISLNPYVDFGIYKKPKTSIKKDTIKIDKHVTEDSNVVAAANRDYSSSLDYLQPPYPMGPVRGTRLELCLEQKECRGLYKRKSQRDNHLPSETTSSINSMSKDLSQVSLCREISESHEVACGRIGMISYPAAVGVPGLDSNGAKSCKNIVCSSTVPVADASIDTAKPDMSLPVESDADKETKVRCTSFNGGSDVLAAKLNGTCTNNGVVSLTGSHISGDPQYTESANECLSPKGDSNADVIENDNGTIEPGLENINWTSQSWRKLVYWWTETIV
ncbi:uncharacterized protein LOC130789036 isoform X1 [Actinidia eriantha]|uniref:uncharacterized protein LOC130789036 isoform X1 n=2 Tax=Actinidia eriantha TaxID=165200 RepID=UPI0025847BEB|nr:uncharacterized protein LOC130789036 isoform X1 [Actinidia eriantha]XP_057505742.1 uncharacterized protein LOC130789036 isoform X1 [Actinidia eriantha]XP_057505743.1 uncharacterized protein LOC130789036 isoform X1 [Actinidia eriantha]